MFEGPWAEECAEKYRDARTEKADVNHIGRASSNLHPKSTQPSSMRPRGVPPATSVHPNRAQPSDILQTVRHKQMLSAKLSEGADKRRAAILNLRREIAHLEIHPKILPSARDSLSEAPSRNERANAPWSTGLADIDTALPRGEICRNSVHDVVSASHADTPAAFGYLCALIKRLQETATTPSRKKILICQTAKMAHEFGPLYRHGLEAFGIDPADIICVETTKNAEALWALEEGARSGSLLAVAGEIESASFTETRRLSLASAATETPTLLLRHHRAVAVSAAVTRWHVRAHQSAPDPLNPQAPHKARWQVALSRCRGGQPGEWSVEWDHEAHCFSLVQDICSRSAGLGSTPAPKGAQRYACA